MTPGRLHKQAQSQVKANFWSIWKTSIPLPDRGGGRGHRRAGRPPPSGRRLYPAAVDCLCDGLERPPTYTSPPVSTGGGTATRTFERTFGETRRRVKVIGRLPAERSLPVAGSACARRAGRGWREGWRSPGRCGSSKTSEETCVERRRRATPSPPRAETVVPAADHRRTLRRSVFTPNLGRNSGRFRAHDWRSPGNPPPLATDEPSP
jgi:hypothetical protein